MLFLLTQNIIDMDILDRFVENALPIAWDYDIDPAEFEKCLGCEKVTLTKLIPDL